MKDLKINRSKLDARTIDVLCVGEVLIDFIGHQTALVLMKQEIITAI